MFATWLGCASRSGGLPQMNQRRVWVRVSIVVGLLLAGAGGALGKPPPEYPGYEQKAPDVPVENTAVPAAEPTKVEPTKVEPSRKLETNSAPRTAPTHAPSSGTHQPVANAAPPAAAGKLRVPPGWTPLWTVPIGSTRGD